MSLNYSFARFSIPSLVAVGFVIVGVAGAAAQAGDFPELGNSRIRVLTPEQCKEDFVKMPGSWRSLQDAMGLLDFTRGKKRLVFRKSGPWAPDGNGDFLEPAGCAPETLEGAMIASRSSVQRQAKALSDFFGRCGAEYKRNGSPTALADLIMTTYEMCEHPRIRKVIMNLETGEIVRGFLAIKPGAARPMIIGKSGVFSNPGDTSQRFMMMHLFDESPFHVLILASSTGADFVNDNRFIEIGGMNEAQHILEAADIMQQSALTSRISTIHSVSVSLGSQSGVFAAYTNKTNPGTDGYPLLTSVLGISPVIDLKASIDGVFKDRNISVLGRTLYDDVKSTVIHRDKSLESLFPPDSIKSEQVPDYMGRHAVRYLQNRGTNWMLYPFNAMDISSLNDYWTANDFLRIASTEPITTPYLSLASMDDPIVKTTPNSVGLQQAVRKFTSRGGGEETQIAAVTVPNGNHTAFSQVYGWRMFSSFIRSYVVSRSPDLLKKRHIAKMSLPADAYTGDDFKLGENEVYYMPKFEFKADDPNVTVTQKIFTIVDEDICTGLPLNRMQRNCLREAKFTFPIASIPQKPAWVRQPVTAAEAESLTRWANASFRIVDQNGKSVDSTTTPGAGLRWISYE